MQRRCLGATATFLLSLICIQLPYRSQGLLALDVALQELQPVMEVHTSFKEWLLMSVPGVASPQTLALVCTILRDLAACNTAN